MLKAYKSNGKQEMTGYDLQIGCYLRVQHVSIDYYFYLPSHAEGALKVRVMPSLGFINISLHANTSAGKEGLHDEAMSGTCASLHALLHMLTPLRSSSKG